MTIRIASRLLTIVVLLSAACRSPVSPPATQTVAAQAREELLASLVVPVSDRVPPVDPSPSVAKNAYVTLDVAIVDSLERGSRVRLRLFDLDLTMRVDQRLRRPRGHTIVGTLEAEAGNVIIYRAPDSVTMSIHLRTADAIEVRGCQNSPCIAVQFKTPPEVRESDHCRALSTGLSTRPPDRPPQPPVLVDILILYTDQVARDPAWSSEATAFGEAMVHVDRINMAMACSEVQAQLRLVGASRVAFMESGNLKTDLDRWVDPTSTDGAELARRRQATGADLVSVVVDEPAATDFGIANVFSDDPSYRDSAVSVVRRDNLAAELVMAHEVGHNFGAGHHRSSNFPDGYKPYSHGWRMDFRRLVRGTAVASIAAPVAYYSNPNVCYRPNSSLPPQPTGTAQANNAQTLNETAARVAGFRQPIVDAIWDLMSCEERIACPKPHRSTDAQDARQDPVDGNRVALGLKLRTMSVVPLLLSLLLLLAWSAAAAPPAPRDVDISAPDGTRLKATYFAADRPGPAVLLMHMCITTRASWEPVARQLSAVGIHALTIDNRGFGESGGPRFESGTPEVQRQLIEIWPGDFDAAVAWLTAQPGVDKSRLGAGGGSCGADNAVKLARRQRAVRSLVLLAGGTDVAGMQHLQENRWLPLFTAAAADDQFGADFPQLMQWIADVSGNPRNRFAGFRDGRHGTEIFGPHPELPRQVVAWFVDTLIASPADPGAAVTPATSAASDLWAAATARGGSAQATQIFRDHKRRDPAAFLFPESMMNLLGYARLQENQTDEAVSLFLLNTEAYPTSANAYDSLADAYIARGQTDLALAAEQKCLELLPADARDDQFKATLRRVAEEKIAKLKGR